MAGDISLETVWLIQGVIEDILYGFSLLMFFITVYALLRHRTLREVNWGMLTMAVSFLSLSTIHMAVNTIRGYEGLIKFKEQGGSINYFADISENTYIWKTASLSVQAALGDGLLMYRAFAVWRTWWSLALTIPFWCAFVAASIVSLVKLNNVVPNTQAVFVPEVRYWFSVFYSTTMACNLIATALLVYKLVRVDRRIHQNRHGKSILLPLILIVVDAAAIYSIFLFVTLVCFLAQSNINYIVASAISPALSISFYLVIIRVAQLKDDLPSSKGFRSSRSRSVRSRPSRRDDTLQLNTIGQQGVQIHISRHTESESGPTFSTNIDLLPSEEGGDKSIRENIFPV